MSRTSLAAIALAAALLVVGARFERASGTPPGPWTEGAPEIVPLLRELEVRDDSRRLAAAAALRSSVQAAGHALVSRALGVLDHGPARDAIDAQRVLAQVPPPSREELEPLSRSESVVARAYVQLRLGKGQLDHARPRPTLALLSSALESVGPMLVPLLSIPERQLLDADPEFADYYRTELAPRLNSPNVGVAHEDALLANLDDDPEPELCVAAAWKDSSFIHGLCFVAVLDQHRTGTWSIASFQKLYGTIHDAFVVDLDGDGDSEFVVAWCFPSGHPVFELLVVANGGEILATHVVRSSYRPVGLLAADAWGPPTIVTWGDGPSGYAGAVDGELLRWSTRGFTCVGDVALPW